MEKKQYRKLGWKFKGNEKEYYQEYSKLNRERKKQQSRESQQRIRRAVIEKYGNKCVCCEEETYEFLSIDPVYGGGTKAREAGGNHQRKLIKYLRDNPVDPSYRVLCHNCNQAIGFYGVCPHEKNRL